MAVIAPPRTYFDWVKVLDAFEAKTDDSATLAAMKGGSVEWQSGVAERFTKKLTDVINSRMNKAVDRFQRGMQNSHGAEGAIIQSILGLRKELALLLDAIDLPAIPQKDRQQYTGLVRAQADSIQQSLEDSAKRDRSGKMSSIVRNHRVNAF